VTGTAPIFEQFTAQPSSGKSNAKTAAIVDQRGAASPGPLSSNPVLQQPPSLSSRDIETIDPHGSVTSISRSVDTTNAAVASDTPSSSRDDLRKRSLRDAFRRRSSAFANSEAASLDEGRKSSLAEPDSTVKLTDDTAASEPFVLALSAKQTDEMSFDGNVEKATEAAPLHHVTTQESEVSDISFKTANGAQVSTAQQITAVPGVDQGPSSTPDAPRLARPLTTIVGGRRLNSDISTSRSPHGARRSRPTSEIMEKGFFSKLKNFSRRISLVATDDKKSQEDLENTPEPGLVRTNGDGIVGTMSLDGWDKDVASKSEQDRLSRVIGAVPAATEEATEPSKNVINDGPSSSVFRTLTGSKPIRIAPPIPMNPPRRVETWDFPDADLPPRTPRNNSATSALLAGARLGILPSPATTMHDGSSPTKSQRLHSSGEDRARVREFGSLSEVNEHEVVDADDNAANREFGEPLNEQEPNSSADVASSHVPASEATSLAPPAHARRRSDLTSLPSQRSRQSTAPNSPTLRTNESLAEVLAEARVPREQDEGGLLDGVVDQPVGAAVLAALASGDEDARVQQTKAVEIPSLQTRNLTEPVAGNAVSAITSHEGSVSPIPPTSPPVDTMTDSSGSALPPVDLGIATLASYNDKLDKVASRDSPVSSLGEPSPPIADEAPPSAIVDTSRPGETIGARVQTKPAAVKTIPAQQYVRSASALTRPPMPDRPMSFAPQPRDPQGRIIPEAINTTESMVHPEPETLSPGVDLADYNGPPVGLPPFQQHPALRSNHVGTEYADLRSSNAASNVGQTELDRDAASRSQSGFFRSRASSSGPNTIAPSNISDAHGLEDLHAAKFSEADIGEDVTMEDKPPKQRNSMWKSKRRVSEQGKPDVGPDRTLITEMRKNSIDATTPRPNTLRKLQRTSSSQIESKANKKRFSGLGALFGRSEAKDTPKDTPRETVKDVPPFKSNRLTKRDGDRRRPADSQVLPSGTVAGHVDNYRAFEALQQQSSDIPAPPTRPAPRPAPRRADSSDQEGQAYPVPDGWFDAEPLPRQQVPARSQSDARQQQSSSYRQQGASGSIPEAFRPVSTSFQGSVDPIGPPVSHAQPSQESYSSGPQPPGRMLPLPSRSAQAQRISPQQYQQRYEYFQSFQQSSTPDVESPQTNTQSLDFPRDRAQYEYRFEAENSDHRPGHQVYDDRSSRQQAHWPSDAPQNGHASWQGRQERHDYPPFEDRRQHHSYNGTSSAHVSPGGYSSHDNVSPQSPAGYAQSQSYQGPTYQQRQSQQHYQQIQPSQQRRQPLPSPYEQQRHRGTRVNKENYIPSYNKHEAQQRFYAPDTDNHYNNNTSNNPTYDHAPMYTQNDQALGPPHQAGRSYHDPAHYRPTGGFSEHGPPPGPPQPRRNPSDDAGTMRGASYPGQEWTAEEGYGYLGRGNGREEWR
jgi:hypothetical protein